MIADVWFEGRVQGVGFRWHTAKIAREFEVAGTVENLSDGRVYLHAEGSEREVLSFIETIENEMKSFIASVEKQFREGETLARGFSIEG